METNIPKYIHIVIQSCMFSCLKFGIEISMLEEKSLMVLIVLGNLKYNKKSTFKSEVFSSLKSCFISDGTKY